MFEILSNILQLPASTRRASPMVRMVPGKDGRLVSVQEWRREQLEVQKRMPSSEKELWDYGQRAPSSFKQDYDFSFRAAQSQKSSYDFTQ